MDFPSVLQFFRIHLFPKGGFGRRFAGIFALLSGATKMSSRLTSSPGFSCGTVTTRG